MKNDRDFDDLFFYAARCEQWLRFFFIKDIPGREDAAQIAVPADEAARFLQEHPELYALFNALDGKEVSMERSRDAIVDWVCLRLGIEQNEGAANSMNMLVRDRDFLHRMDMHSGWVQAVADGGESASGLPLADGHVPSFNEWSTAFFAWLGKQSRPMSADSGKFDETS